MNNALRATLGIRDGYPITRIAWAEKYIFLFASRQLLFRHTGAGIEGIIIFYLTPKNEYLIVEIKMVKKEERLH